MPKRRVSDQTMIPSYVLNRKSFFLNLDIDFPFTLSPIQTKCRKIRKETYIHLVWIVAFFLNTRSYQRNIFYILLQEGGRLRRKHRVRACWDKIIPLHIHTLHLLPEIPFFLSILQSCESLRLLTYWVPPCVNFNFVPANR